MNSSNLLITAMKAAGIGGMSIALLYLTSIKLLETKFIQSLEKTARAWIVALVVGGVLVISGLGIVGYLYSTKQPITGNVLQVGGTAKIGRDATLGGQTTVGKDLTVERDLRLGSRKDVVTDSRQEDTHASPQSKDVETPSQDN